MDDLLNSREKDRRDKEIERIVQEYLQESTLSEPIDKMGDENGFVSLSLSEHETCEISDEKSEESAEI